MPELLIVGGGIAGLATALAAAAGGFRVTVLERNDEFAELGAGIQLAPNAFAALDQLGVAAAVRARAVFVDELRMMDATSGAPILRFPLTEAYRRRFGNPYAVAHRGDLYKPLLQACLDHSAIQLRAGRRIVGYEAGADTVTAVGADGQRWRGDVLIGADGIRSAVRRQLLGDGPPRLNGHTIYRSLIPMSSVPPDLRSNAVTLWAGPGLHFVHYPVVGGTAMNVAAIRDDRARHAAAGEPVGEDAVAREFPELTGMPHEVLALGREWRRWTLCDRNPAPVWTEGRVGLVGDAAHPMVHYAAQGAAMALEDAVLLGRVLRPGGDHAEQLRTFTATRRDRAARVQVIARALGALLYHPAGDRARDRDDRLRAMSEREMHDRVAWLHGPRDFSSLDSPARPAPARTATTRSSPRASVRTGSAPPR